MACHCIFSWRRRARHSAGAQVLRACWRRGRTAIELYAEPGPEFLSVGYRAPNPLPRRAQKNLLFNAICAHATSWLQISKAGDEMQPAGCSISCPSSLLLVFPAVHLLDCFLQLVQLILYLVDLFGSSLQR